MGIVKSALLVAFIGWGCITSAQTNPSIDSIERATRNLRDTSLVRAWNELVWQYRTVDASKAIGYAEQSITLSRRLNYEAGLAQAHNDVSIVYLDRGAFDTSLAHLNEALRIRRQTGDSLGAAKAWNKIGIVHQKAGAFDKALDAQLSALRLFRAADNTQGISFSLNNIAILQQNLGRYDEAIRYGLESVRIKEEASDKKGLAQSFVNLGNVYLLKKDFAAAEDYFSRSVRMAREVDDKEYLASALNNLARLFITTGRHAQGFGAAQESFLLRQSLGDTKGMVSSLNNLGLIHLAAGRIDSAEAALTRGLRMAEGEESCKPELPALYQSLSQLYERRGDTARALAMHKLFAASKDSVFTSELGQRFAELEARFETLQKEEEIRRQKYAIERRNYIIGAVASLSLLGTLLGVSYYRRARLRQRARHQTELLRQQSAATRAVIEAEEAERQRIAKDLHDGVGQLMSAAKMNLVAFGKAHGIGDELDWDNIISLVDDSCREVRAVSHNMMPNALLKGSLAAALREFLTKVDGRALRVNLYTEGLDVRLDATTEIVLYRVIQECVNNVIKHAGASTLDVSVVCDEAGFSVTIEDDGGGFSPAAPDYADGLGLKNIRTRVEYLKGTVEVDSAVGRGTVVMIFVPAVPGTAAEDHSLFQ